MGDSSLESQVELTDMPHNPLIDWSYWKSVQPDDLSSIEKVDVQNLCVPEMPKTITYCASYEIKHQSDSAEFKKKSIAEIRELLQTCTKHDNPLQVHLTQTTDEYRVCALKHITPSTNLLELGCSTGECTTAILKLHPSLNIIAVDVSTDFIKTCRQKFQKSQNIAVIYWDAIFDTGETLNNRAQKQREISHPSSDSTPETEKTKTTHADVDTILLDIGGDRNCLMLLYVIARCRILFPVLRQIILKSKFLPGLVNKFSGEFAESSDWTTQFLSVIEKFEQRSRPPKQKKRPAK